MLIQNKRYWRKEIAKDVICQGQTFGSLKKLCRNYENDRLKKIVEIAVTISKLKVQLMAPIILVNEMISSVRLLFFF